MDTTEIILYFSIVIVIAILLVFLFLFFKGSSWVQTKFMEEHTGKMQAEVMSMERERRRMAEDLHDETGGMIYDMLRNTEMIEPKDQRSKELLASLQDKIRQMDESVQDITGALLPMNLKQYGINNALRDLVIQRQGTAGIAMQLYDVPVPALGEDRLLHLYRIVQECMNNAIKHSKASVLAITVRMEYQNIVVSVSDNGRGFDSLLLKNPREGLGLDTIYNRIHFLGGEVYLNSRNGCEWIFYVPIKTKHT